MSPIPLGLSISVTFISAITVIGLPTEAYVFGLIAAWYSLSTVGGTIFACIYYIPLYHRLKLTTVYEYLEMRFHKRNRVFASGMETFSLLLYMGTTVYVPALALSAVTPMSTNMAIVVTSSICTIYTVCGGLKAVVWTDALQSGIMFVGSLAAFIQGTVVVGGFGNVWKALERSGRVNFWVFDLDPRIRPFWSLMVGASMSRVQLACCNQSICQRYLSCKSAKDARIAAIFSVAPKIVLTLIAIACGAAAYAYFEHCDPLKNGDIHKSDQILPYMVLKIFSDLPGMAGLFVAAAYSGTLSTVSSGINSLSAMVLEDFILPRKPHMSTTAQMTTSKVTGIIMGVVLTTVAYLCSMTTGTVLALVSTFRGSCGGPMLAVYTLGLFFPWCNGIGALAGQLVGTTFCLWIGLGGLIYGRDPKYLRKLPTQTDGCLSPTTLNSSLVDIHSNTTWIYDTKETTYSDLYSISFMYFSMIGFIITIFIGLLVSFATGANDPKKMDPKVFVPIIDNQCFPKNIRHFFRFGVPMPKPENDFKIGNTEELEKFKSKESECG
uniref:Sodium-coupled monocarboxylate transporter 1 n=1 Tax=Ciona savignyi TaxID=51511 RepID=H2YAS1_CIOSA